VGAEHRFRHASAAGPIPVDLEIAGHLADEHRAAAVRPGAREHAAVLYA
jgi:hypothetical protein